MKPIKLNYSAFQPLDIYHTHSNKPVGRIIRWACRRNVDPKDDLTPTHSGFVYPTNGQFLAAEMNPRLSLKTLEQYVGRHEQIVEVWRVCEWDAEKKQEAIESLAYILRKNAENTRYDLWGAITASPVGKAILGLFPAFRNKPNRWFCSEMVGTILKKYADPLIPEALSPLDLSLYFQRTGKPKYVKVEGWKA
jgi:hypothetical protein